MKCSLASILAAAAAVPFAAHAEVTYQILAKSGDIAPGAAGTFTGFDSDPGINNQGKVIFTGDVATFTDGMWVGIPGNILPVAIEGQPAVGVPGATYGGFTSGETGTILAPDGGVAFGASLRGVDSSLAAALYCGPVGAVQKIQQKGTSAPGRPGETFTEPSGGSLNSYALFLRSANRVAFGGATSGAGDRRGVWGGLPGSIVMMAGTGQPTAFGNLESVVPNEFALAADGSVYGKAYIDGLSGVWRFTNGGSLRLYQQGDFAPGTATTFSNHPSFGQFTDIQYFAPQTFSFSGAILDGGNFVATAHVQTNAGTRLLYRGGEVAPGGGGAITSSYATYFNENGAAAAALFATGGFSGLYYAPPGLPLSSWKKIFLVGETAPGTGGATFTAVFDGYFCLNANGLVAFRNSLGNTASTANESIWVWDPATEELTLIAREGTPLDLGDGMMHTPQFSPTLRGGGGAAAGRTSGLNDHGQIAFEMTDQNFTEFLVIAQYTADPGSVSYADWAESEQLTALNNGITEDPNKDGVPNLAAYFLGVKALGPTAGSGISTGLDAAGDQLILRFSSPKYVTGVTVGSQIGTGLAPGSWQVGPVPQMVGSTDDANLYELAVPAGGGATFARLIFAQ
ncbi:MAG: hypothetical protein R3F11_30230 [Verrucomicrobiales bacterium]